MNTYDVVVVGARVAGASTAMLLARAGLRVALVDRAGYGSDTVSTHALMRAGVMQLSRWGLLPTVTATGVPPVRRTLFHYGREESVEISIRPSVGVDALYAPRRHLLDRILVDAAAQAGAEVLHDTVVTGLLRDADGRVTGVRTGGRARAGEELHARITIGADGIRSVVAQEVGAQVERESRHGGAVLYRYVADLPLAGYEWTYGDRAAAGAMPTNDGAACVFVGTTPGRLRSLRAQGTERAFRELLEAGGPRLVDRVESSRPLTRLHGWSGVRGYVRRSWGPGWALVGDAGYFKDPCTAHGMTDALRDAELLADEVLEALTGITPEPVALARYQATRDRLSRRLFEVTDAVAGYRWDLDEVRTLLRRLNSAMSDEVDHLQALPARLGRPAPARPHTPDNRPLPR